MIPFKIASQLPDVRKRLRGTTAAVAITEPVMPLTHRPRHGREIGWRFDGGVRQLRCYVVHAHGGNMTDVCRQHIDEESVENCRSSMFSHGHKKSNKLMCIAITNVTYILNRS